MRVSGGRKINHLNEIGSTSFFFFFIEANIYWEIQSGDGNFDTVKKHKFTGEYSLQVEASPGKDLVLRGLLSQTELSQPHLLVFSLVYKEIFS